MLALAIPVLVIPEPLELMPSEVDVSVTVAAVPAVVSEGAVVVGDVAVDDVAVGDVTASLLSLSSTHAGAPPSVVTVSAAGIASRRTFTLCMNPV